MPRVFLGNIFLNLSSAINNLQGDQQPAVIKEDEKNTPVKDENPTVKVIASQHVIEDEVHSVYYVTTKESAVTTGKQPASDIVKEQQRGNVSGAGTLDQDLQATPSNNTAGYVISQTDSNEEFNIEKTISECSQQEQTLSQTDGQRADNKCDDNTEGISIMDPEEKKNADKVYAAVDSNNSRFPDEAEEDDDKSVSLVT